MEDSNPDAGDKTDSKGRFPLAALIAFGLIVSIPLAALTFFVKSKTVAGTTLVYEVEGESADTEEIVAPLQRRLEGIADASVSARDARTVEVTVRTRDRITLEVIKDLVETAGVLRFLIVANRRDHQLLIDTAATQSERRMEERISRDVVDPQGSIVGRWATVSRDDALANETPPFRVNVSNAIVRNGDSGRIIDVPPDIREAQDEVAIAKWIDEQGIKSLDVLMVVDPLLEVGGTDLAFAAMTFDQNGSPAVAFTLTDAGAGRFFALTTTNAPSGPWRRQLGIVLDDQLLSAPNILSAIRKEGRITGQFTPSEVDTIVRILQAGQLPVKLQAKPTSETSIDLPMQLSDLWQNVQ